MDFCCSNGHIYHSSQLEQHRTQAPKWPSGQYRSRTLIWFLATVWPITISMASSDCIVHSYQQSPSSQMGHEHQHKPGLQLEFKSRCGPWWQHGSEHCHDPKWQHRTSMLIYPSPAPMVAWLINIKMASMLRTAHPEMV